MRVLIVDDRVPDPHFGAGFPRAYRLLLSLVQLGHDIFFYPIIKQSIEELNPTTLKNYRITVCENLESIQNEQIDTVLMSRPHNVHYYLPKVRKYFPSAKVIYDTEALWFRRYDLQLSITGRLPNWAYRYDEVGLAKQVDLCFTVNDIEKNILESNGAKVVKLGHALDVHDKGLDFAQRSGLLFVGGKMEEDSSNEDALWWYLESCWDQLKDNYSFFATGDVQTARLKNHTFPNVNLLGHVPSLIEMYESKRAFVAATRFATGIPWKVHEAMAHGIPCLISTLLANQLGVTDGVEALVAGSPSEFIEKSKLIHDDISLWNQIRNNGFDLIRRDCSPEDFKNILQANLV